MPSKIVIGHKGKALQKDVDESLLVGRKIGDKVSGSEVGFEGYDFEITGGSDNCGFPMRKDVEGVNRKRILSVQGIGVKKVHKGLRIRKSVAGNTVHSKTAQVNLKVVKEGSAPLFSETPAVAEVKA